MIADRLKGNGVALLQRVAPIFFKCSNTTTKQKKTGSYICISNERDLLLSYTIKKVPPFPYKQLHKRKILFKILYLICYRIESKELGFY